jgi:hypothetical protein
MVRHGAQTVRATRWPGCRTKWRPSTVYRGAFSWMWCDGRCVFMMTSMPLDASISCPLKSKKTVFFGRIPHFDHSSFTVSQSFHLFQRVHARCELLASLQPSGPKFNLEFTLQPYRFLTPCNCCLSNFPWTFFKGTLLHKIQKPFLVY